MFTFLDTETTGLTPDSHDIINFAVGSFEDKFTLNNYFRNTYLDKIPPEASEVNHITKNKVKDYPYFAYDLDEELKNLKYDETSYYICHNSTFDIDFIYKTLKKKYPDQEERYLKFSNTNHSICTLKLSKKLFELNKHSLQFLRYYHELNIEEGQAHTANYDVLVLKEFFIFLCDYCLNKKIIKEETLLSDLHTICWDKSIKEKVKPKDKWFVKNTDYFGSKIEDIPKQVLTRYLNQLNVLNPKHEMFDSPLYEGVQKVLKGK